ncbi:GNAT family N-acetyltransferase [Ruegeria pomeroyi]|nr:GNAT family N-acetyltransferase [Ruegeria pomeroyi]NVK98977.1 GNAT family N-acetyltransferase [Ruegeria pomeroyi]NVL03328.1 GNAT family N-acetyltransferase [Ruegeria pomeroyi]QWV09284.1 GNAT family N-acetyltransferase [Ruegeria pomeroyi]
MIVRQAGPADAAAMSAVLHPILTGWNSARSGDAETVLTRYIDDPDRLSCAVACEGERILGFQSLKLARAGNVYDLPAGWGIIGTYVAGDAGRRGIGRALFTETLAAARRAGLAHIDATIGADNAQGLPYYSALGFQTWRELDGAVGKRFDLSATEQTEGT